MANQYFQFKQFLIHQEHCAMKVCTDSCILGAYTPVDGAQRILDIGTGTGLLALMLAQRSTAQIDAVEIDKAAASQATENVNQSPFRERIHVTHASIQAFSLRAHNKYDLIISNPPFFTNHLKRRQHSQNIALHSESLQLSELAIIVSYLLDKQGRFVVMLPVHETSILEEAAAEVKLFPYEKLNILERHQGKCIRVITSFSLHEQDMLEKKLYIKSEADTYTEEFVQLLQPYYLHM